MKWKFFKRMVLALLVLVVVLVLGVLGVLEWKYQAILSSPRMDAKAYALPHASILARVDPSLAQDYLIKSQLEPRNIPPWLAGLAMPYETLIQFDPDLTSGKSDIRLLVNSRRLGPVLAGTANQSVLTRPFGNMTWKPEGMVCPERGVLLLDGESRLGPATVELIRTHWGVMTPLLPLEIGGGHLIEAVIDMRDGRGYAVLAEELGRNTRPQEVQHPANLVHFFVKMDHLRIYADIVSETELGITLDIECLPTIDSSEVNSLRGLVDLIYNQVRPVLQNEFGVILEGSVVTEGQTVHGKYTLSDFNVLVKSFTSGK